MTDRRDNREWRFHLQHRRRRDQSEWHGTIALSPMTSGTYQGITVFQDRSSAVGATMSAEPTSITPAHSISGLQIDVKRYQRGRQMGAQVIAKDITFSGTAGIQVNYDSSVAGKRRWASFSERAAALPAHRAGGGVLITVAGAGGPVSYPGSGTYPVKIKM